MQESVPAVGQEAPDFTLPATRKEALTSACGGGDAVTLSQYRGHKTVVVAFYALDWTGG